MARAASVMAASQDGERAKRSLSPHGEYSCVPTSRPTTLPCLPVPAAISRNTWAPLESREKIMLGLSRKRVDRLKGLIRQVWEQKETIKSIAGYVGELAGVFGKGVVAPALDPGAAQ